MATFETTLLQQGNNTGIDALAPSRRKAHVVSVEGAKAAETRSRRITSVVDSLS